LSICKIGEGIFVRRCGFAGSGSLAGETSYASSGSRNRATRRRLERGFSIMSVPAPHFLLFSEARRAAAVAACATACDDGQMIGQWRFVLESLDGAAKLEVCDDEPEAEGERLDLLAVVRGLEALDQPSRVTLVTQSQYVSRGLRYGLDEWRENGWQWERFGQMAPVKNGDLWQRVDRALAFHEVECRTWRFDRSADDLDQTPLRPPQTAAPVTEPRQTRQPAAGRRKRRANLGRRLPSWCKVLWSRMLRRIRRPIFDGAD
jgi:ribonuclease HI